jgi:hypothetical protein
MRPAGLIALLGAALFVTSGVAGSVGSGTTAADQLADYHNHSSRLLIAAVVSSIAMVLFTVPLFFLFRSAVMRAARMRSFVGGFVLVAPTLIAIQGVIFGLGLRDASPEYVAGVPTIEAQVRQQAAKEAQGTTSSETNTSNGPSTATKGTPSTDAPTTTTAGASKPLSQRIDAAKVDFATKKIDSSSKVQVARILAVVGGLGFLIGVIYTLLWCIRTGLLRRLAAIIGMFFLGVLVLVPQLPPLGVVLWFAVIGLMLSGWWFSPLPPAWAAAEAIPWPRGGEDIGPPIEKRDQGDVLESTGRETSEVSLPEDGAEQAQATDQYGQTQGQRRKKRKRRG